MTLRGRPAVRRLYLMRHAEAVGHSADFRDETRELTPAGRIQAHRAGELLATVGFDQVWCSTAIRTRQTAEILAIAAPIHHCERLYNAGFGQLLAEITAFPEQARTVLVVGHAPGIPAVAAQLADPQSSDPAALALIGQGFAPATVVGLEFTEPWPELGLARLFTAHRC